MKLGKGILGFLWPLSRFKAFLGSHIQCLSSDNEDLLDSDSSHDSLHLLIDFLDDNEYANLARPLRTLLSSSIASSVSVPRFGSILKSNFSSESLSRSGMGASEIPESLTVNEFGDTSSTLSSVSSSPSVFHNSEAEMTRGFRLSQKSSISENSLLAVG